MKKLDWLSWMQITGCCFIAAMLLVACDETTENITQVNQQNMSVISEETDLPKCSKENEGALVYVKQDGVTRVCIGDKWKSATGRDTVYEHDSDTVYVQGGVDTVFVKGGRDTTLVSSSDTVFVVGDTVVVSKVDTVYVSKSDTIYIAEKQSDSVETNADEGPSGFFLKRCFLNLIMVIRFISKDFLLLIT